jgi:hypothetical protein
MPNTVASLPPDFLQWLEKLPESHVVQYNDNQWQFWTLEELQSSTRVNKLTTTHLSVLTGFVAMYRATGLTAAKGPGGKPFPYERLDRCLTLATDNEYYLIVDPDEQYSVWKFCPDYAKCGEVKPVATSLTLFLEEAKVEEAEGDDWDDDL